MYEYYKVNENDTLESIASNYKTTPKNLIELNHLQPIYRINKGEDLKVPIKTSNLFEYYIIKKGDTIYSIAEKHNMTPKELLILNNLNPNDYIYPNQKLLVPKKNVGLQLTKMGDSIEILSKKYNLSKDELLRYNEKLYLLPDQLIVYKINQ